MQYEDMIFKVPVESTDYKENSEFVIRQMNLILDRQKEIGDNKIIINTNLRMGLPLENINKIAGPMIEAWAGEVFAGIRDDMNNPYRLVNVEAQERLGMADIILQFKKDDKSITGNVDVKATANDIPNSGKGPNITSFSRIRTAYVKDPDFMFIILSIIGIDINPEYIQMTKERLNEPFSGFDSIDEKMKRCPNDLNDAKIRIDYIENHIKWFLKNHPDAINEFLEEVKAKYLIKMIETGQTWIFDQYGVAI